MCMIWFFSNHIFLFLANDMYLIFVVFEKNVHCAYKIHFLYSHHFLMYTWVACTTYILWILQWVLMCTHLCEILKDVSGHGRTGSDGCFILFLLWRNWLTYLFGWFTSQPAVCECSFCPPSCPRSSMLQVWAILSSITWAPGGLYFDFCHWMYFDDVCSLIFLWLWYQDISNIC